MGLVELGKCQLRFPRAKVLPFFIDTIMLWIAAQRAIVVERFFLKTGTSVFATQISFVAHFMLHRNVAEEFDIAMD